MDAEALASLRPLERREAVRARLAADRLRIVDEPRPEHLACFAAATADGVCAVAPLEPPDLRVTRRERLAATLAGAVAEAAELGYPQDGRDAVLEAATWSGFVAVRVPVRDGQAAAELVEVALEGQAASLDRLGPVGVLLPAGSLDETEPLDAPWLWRAELAARLGAPAGAARLSPEAEDALARFAAARPPDEHVAEAAAAHVDAVPARRVVRRILRRLDGMGKYGGYHTEFSHLARGFAGHERSLALEAGETLLRAGLLDEKPSVGQRHVALVASRTADIKRLVDRGETDDPVLLAFFAAHRRGGGE